MAYKLRVQHPERLYLVTSRCLGAQHLMRPDAECCRIILACLARFVVMHGIEVYGFVFMSNHYHLLCSAPKLNLSAFLQDLNSSIARRLNKHRGREGVFFAKRYSVVDVLDAQHTHEKLLYILMNPCAAGLVEHPDEYPGVSACEYLLSDEKVRGTWLDLKRFHRNHKRNPKVRKEDYETTYEFEIKPIPQWLQLAQAERAGTLKETLAKRSKKIKKTRTAEGKKHYLGPKKCRQLDPFSAPKHPKKSGYSACVAADSEVIQAYTEQRKTIESAYRKARRLDCRAVRTKSVKGVCYPPGTLPPGCRQCVPFEQKSCEA